MAISPVSSSPGAVNATQAARPAPPPVRAERPDQKTQEQERPATVYQAAPPKPVVNQTGQTVGTIINVTA